MKVMTISDRSQVSQMKYLMALEASWEGDGERICPHVNLISIRKVLHNQTTRILLNFSILIFRDSSFHQLMIQIPFANFVRL